MIVQETFKDNFLRTYSDEGYQILQVETNRIYNSAIDIVPCKYTYEEIISDNVDYEKIIDIITGNDFTNN